MRPANPVPEMTCWTPNQLMGLDLAPSCLAPLVGAADIELVGADLAVWDAWPLLTRHNELSPHDLWMALASPWFDDPDERHGHARIHLLQRTAKGWRSFGPAMPDGFSPGSREWSGSACIEADGETVTLYFTAAGRKGEAQLTFEQRLFEARASLVRSGDQWQMAGWRGLAESVTREPAFYMDTQTGHGAIGTIKAFRDPGYFRDPQTGLHWLFFTASLADGCKPFNGAIGAAVAQSPRAAGWAILPPIVGAGGVNNELERPHVVRSQGLYYLFWSTQAHVFDPAGPVGPTGLYGMVSSSLSGGWRPLNGSGLVIANPPEAPRQAYSWLVLPDLTVTSFVDDWGRGPDDAGARRFGGGFAPFLKLELDGATTRVAAA